MIRVVGAGVGVMPGAVDAVLEVVPQAATIAAMDSNANIRFDIYILLGLLPVCSMSAASVHATGRFKW
jgi:hypothetical protein